MVQAIHRVGYIPLIVSLVESNSNFHTDCYRDKTTVSQFILEYIYICPTAYQSRTMSFKFGIIVSILHLCVVTIAGRGKFCLVPNS